MSQEPPRPKPVKETNPSHALSPKVFGARLIELRKQKFMTLRQLAEKAGIKVDYLSQYERGDKLPMPKTIHKLAEALDITVEELVNPREEGARLLTPGTSKSPHVDRGRLLTYLLNARCQQVSFFGGLPDQNHLLQELKSWCNDEVAIAARLLHGAAGTGKTRLLIEYCGYLQGEGWRAGFLAEKVLLTEFERLVESAKRRYTMVVIDYADSRQDLVSLLQVVTRYSHAGMTGRFRLVLLARSAGDWWNALRQRDVSLDSLLSDTVPLEVTNKRLDLSMRKDLFQHAARCFAVALRQPEASWQPPLDLEGSHFERVLFILMAALATVAQLPLEAKDLQEGLLRHEERFWLMWQESAEPGEPSDLSRRVLLETCRKAVTALTLVGGAASRQEADQLLLHACGEREKLLLLLLRDLYPGGGEEAGLRYVGPLEPDLLGEALVRRTLEQEGNEAQGWLRKVFAVADEQGLCRGFGILGRLATMSDSTDAARKAMSWVVALFEGNVTKRAVIAIEAARALGGREGGNVLDEALASVLDREGTIEVARKLEQAGLPDSSSCLQRVSAWVVATLSQSPEVDNGERNEPT
jgi:transcriptional regulator with XRE-family HTH domain/DNA polymerase III delta prime subunit